jgi:hypothetical protein
VGGAIVDFHEDKLHIQYKFLCLVVYRYTRVIGITHVLLKMCNMHIYINEGLMVYGNRVVVIQSLILEDFVLNDFS